MIITQEQEREARRRMTGMGWPPTAINGMLKELKEGAPSLWAIEQLLTNNTTSTSSTVVCPDLFGLRHLGLADNRRGRLVRGFARLLDRVWPA